MGRYAGSVVSSTPVVGEDEWALTAAANEYGLIEEFSFGGEATTSTAMRTDVTRNSTNGITPTAGNVQNLHPFQVANVVAFSVGWSTQPIAAAGNLFSTSWNAHGGVVRWLAAPGEEFVILDATAGENEISCEAGVGTGTSSYGVIWREM